MAILKITAFIVIIAAASLVLYAGTQKPKTYEEEQYEKFLAAPKYETYREDVALVNSLNCDDFISRQYLNSITGLDLSAPKLDKIKFPADFNYTDFYSKNLVLLACSYEQNITHGNYTFKTGIGVLIYYVSIKGGIENFDKNLSRFENPEHMPIGQRAIVYTLGSGVIENGTFITRRSSTLHIVSVLRNRVLLTINAGYTKLYSGEYTRDRDYMLDYILPSDPIPIYRETVIEIAKAVNENLNKRIPDL